MTFEGLFQLDARVWPLAVMAFLRIVTMFAFLPILGETAIPRQLRLALGLLFTLCLWPAIATHVRTTDFLLQWSPLTLAIATFREVVFGFAVAFAARMVLHAASIGAQLVGVNMGFQTATLFSQASGHEESAFSVLQGWIAIMIVLGLNIHHVFLEGIAHSFQTVPIGAAIDGGQVAKAVVQVVTTSFILGVKLAAPLLVLQLLVNVALGCLSRSVPQLNVFVLSFPISFILSMVVLFLGAGMYVRHLAGQGMAAEVNAFSNMQRAFSVPPAGGPR